MIPLYGCQAVGGKIYSLDDPTVVKDGAALNGTGGTAFSPYAVTSPFGIAFDLGYNKLRRFLQRIAHAGGFTLTVTGIRDGQDSGITIVRTLTLSDVGIVNIPLNDAGSDFQIKMTLSAWDAEVALGNSQVFIVPKRRFR